jgi:hypothetical protein
MLKVLAQMRQNAETGALFVLEDRASGSGKRKEIYLLGGRLHHVASSEKGELLGEYLVRKGRLTREQLTMALSTLAANRGRLGDTLIGLGFVQAVDVFRAIRDQGRDRVASLCLWEVGTASFYRGTTPGHVEFPLDLDLASPMMAGVLARAKKDIESLPKRRAKLGPGPRRPAFASARERGTAPISMLLLPKMSDQKMSVGDALDFLTRPPSHAGQRQVHESEAMAALCAAQSLGWVTIL